MNITNITDISDITGNYFDITACRACPRRCGADRTKTVGFCGIGDRIKIARAAPHLWEEPCISGTRGSGAIFFSGCSLGCVFCQNKEISRGIGGCEITAERFAEICFELRSAGVHNINLVTPSHQLPLILPTLREIKKTIGIPIVCNCGGYESPEALSAMRGIVDIYLPDFKFHDPALSEKYAHAKDYPQIAEEAIVEMARQTGRPTFDKDGLLRRGTLVRHLVLPGHRDDSINALGRLRELFAPDEILLSLMSQYTPVGDGPSRRLTTFEYRSVANVALELGFEGYFQERSSAKEEYTPSFDLTGVKG